MHRMTNVIFACNTHKLLLHFGDTRVVTNVPGEFQYYFVHVLFTNRAFMAIRIFITN